MEQSALLGVPSAQQSVGRRFRVAGELFGLLTLAVFLGYVMQRLHQANLSALFLLAVLIVAARHGVWPSILTSALGFLAFNFFFTAPYRSFRVADEGDIATLIFFLAVAVLGGNLASRLRSAIRRRDQALERISYLYEFSNSIAGATEGPEILQTLVDHLAKTLDAESLVTTHESGQEPRIIAASNKVDTPNEGEPATAIVKLDASQLGMNQQEWTTHELTLAEHRDALLAIRRADLSDDQFDLVRNLCGQAELAIDRVRLTADLEATRREAERARLRSALLTSVSHDLRTPLASIIGAASTLQELHASLAESDRADLFDTVIGESRRLNGYIQNLLDMTRIEHGELRIHRDWEEPSDLIGASIRLARDNWPDAPINTRIADGVGLVFVHGELLVQALHNVLDNAIRYSTPGAPVEIICSHNGNGLQIEFIDSGPGLTEDQRTRMFDMFYRADSLDSRSGGTGLGLTITRGIMEAHGGKVYATANKDRPGTRIVVELGVVTPEDSRGNAG